MSQKLATPENIGHACELDALKRGLKVTNPPYELGVGGNVFYTVNGVRILLKSWFVRQGFLQKRWVR